MSNALLASKIAIIEEQPTVPSIQPASLSDTAALLTTERGPVGGPPVLCTGEAQYKKVFGGVTANTQGALAAQLYFDEGGTSLWVSRTVHYTDVTNPSTKTSVAETVTLATSVLAASPAFVTSPSAGPYALASGDTIIGSLNSGGPYTATFTAASGTVTSTNGAPFALSDGLTIVLVFDGGVTVTTTFHTGSFVSIGAATAAEVVAVIQAAINGASANGLATVSGSNVVLTSTTKGTGSSVQIVSGSALTALGFTASTHAGSGNVADLGAVTAAEVASIVSGAFTGTAGTVAGGAPVISTTATGTVATIQVTSGTARTKIGFDALLHSGTAGGAIPTLTINAKTDGALGLSVEPETATDGVSGHFNFVVLQQGAEVEVWPNLSMVPTDPSYIVTILNDPTNGSDYVQAADLAAGVPVPSNSPATGTFALTGGNTGLSGLVDADFVGNAAGPTGLRCFDRTPSLRILVVPGEATPVVHNAMLTYCETVRFGSLFAVLDPPAAQTSAQILNYVQNTALLEESSEFGAIYWPRIVIGNPDTTVFGTATTIVVPPSAAIAGRYAANDASKPGGIYEAPAGLGTSPNGIGYGRLTSAVGLETSEVSDENVRDLIYPALINPIVGLEGLPIHMDGCKTLLSTGNFPTIGERRGMIFIEASLKTGLVFAKHRKIKPAFFRALQRAVNGFLAIQMNNGAFASDDPATAFSSNFGPSLNPPSEALALRANGRIGVATAKPAEWIVLRVGQDTSALEAAALQAAQAA